MDGMTQPPHAMFLGDTETDYYVQGVSHPGASAGAERPQGRETLPVVRTGHGGEDAR
jgi:NADH-quinone oxidoreductase subunit I